MRTSLVSRQLVEDLRSGEHHLTNELLRERYGLNRVTRKARADVARELRHLGLEVLSDPAHEPLVVRKTAKQPAARSSWWRRPWAIAVGAIVLLLVIVGATSGSGTQQRPSDEPAVVAETSETVPSETTQAAPAEPVKTAEDAVQAVDDDDYAGALAIAAGLGAREESRTARRISRRLAYRVRSALRTGERSQARTLLARADRYPSTPALQSARLSYREAKARAVARSDERRAAREAARVRAAGRRAAEDAAAAAESAPSPSAPSSSPPELSGPSTTNWCGKRDGDGDGVYCEGE